MSELKDHCIMALAPKKSELVELWQIINELID